MGIENQIISEIPIDIRNSTEYFRSMIFADRLRDRMKAAGVSQNELANRTEGKVSVATVNAYLNDESEPNVERLQAIARAINTTAAYLIGDIDNPAPDALDDLPYSKSEIEEMGFRSRHGSGELADPDHMQKMHLILLRELAEARRKELELRVKESEHDLKKRGIDPDKLAGNT